MITRRSFLEVFGTLIGVAIVPASLTKIRVSPKEREPQYVRDLATGDTFTFAGNVMYRKLADGHYSGQHCLLLTGDANVMRLDNGKKSWMGPNVPINGNVWHKI